MTRFISPTWLDALLEDNAEWKTATVHAYLLGGGTTYDPETDLFLADIIGGDRVAGPVTLTGKDVADGYFTGDPVAFTLGLGDVAEWFILVHIGGSEATSPIIVATDERADTSPLLYTGTGGVITFDPQAVGYGRI